MPRPLPSGLRLRPTRREDAIALYRTQRRAIDGACGYSRAQRRAWLASISPAYIARTLAGRVGVACDQGGVIGFGQLDLGRARVTALYVEPACMRRGIGDALLEQLARLAGAHGLRTLSLQSSPNAVPFYLRRRFVAVATRHLTVPGAPPLEVLELRRDL